MLDRVCNIAESCKSGYRGFRVDSASARWYVFVRDSGETFEPWGEMDSNPAFAFYATPPLTGDTWRKLAFAMVSTRRSVCRWAM